MGRAIALLANAMLHGSGDGR